MNTMQLACFAEVASTLSFSQAANNLHVSQPTVSHQIKSLEDELGCTLVARSTRSVALTDAGFEFLGFARDILELAAHARRSLAGEEAHRSGHLRIGMSDGVEARLITPALAALHREDAEFDPIIRMAPHAALMDMLENGAADVVLEYRDPSGAPAGATVFRRLLDAPAAVVCAPDHPLAALGRDGIARSECAGAGRYVVCNPHLLAPALSILQRGLMDHADPKQVMMCPSIEASIALVEAGIGYTLLPDVAAMHRPGPRFIRIDGVGPVTLGVRVRRGRPTRLLERFMAALGATLQAEPGGPDGAVLRCPQ